MFDKPHVNRKLLLWYKRYVWCCSDDQPSNIVLPLALLHHLAMADDALTHDVVPLVDEQGGPQDPTIKTQLRWLASMQACVGSILGAGGILGVVSLLVLGSRNFTNSALNIVFLTFVAASLVVKTLVLCITVRRGR